MSLQTQLIALAQAIGADIKSLKTSTGTLSGLSTTAKSNLVAAINEVYGLVGSGGVTINDASTASTTQTWSASKSSAAIATAISTLQTTLIGGAGAALDTFKELQDALGNDPTFAATVATSLSNRVRFDSAQTLTVAQQIQACVNTGVGDPTTDFVAAYTTAKT
uniref:Tail fiber protein n=1 Tax=Pseudomonas phage Cygsa01 TaxID=3138529 RepID=A0AAU6W408_9VIRU